jgi:transcriptional regulator with XRE-family HTH domain
MQMDLDAFADRLHAARIAKGWPQSELARQVWGEIVAQDTGRKVARNRDRISAYEKGRSWPDPHNLKKIAEALGVKPEELAPDITGSTVERQNPEFAMTAIAGHADKVHLKANKLVRWDTATKVSQLLCDDGAQTATLGPPEPPQAHRDIEWSADPAVRVWMEEVLALRARVAKLEEALEQSVTLQSHYAELLNTYDGGKRLTFASIEAWLDRLAVLSPSTGSGAPQ